MKNSKLWYSMSLLLQGSYMNCRCIMALICGLKGKFPCPVCLVPQDKQSILYTHELCTSHQSEDILHTARSKPSKKEKEEHLKAFSLRNVEVWISLSFYLSLCNERLVLRNICLFPIWYLSILTSSLMYFNYKNVFSRIHHVNVHQALYFDCLHTNEEGLWGDHLWKEVKFWISDLGHEVAVKLDKKYVLQL
jgi:hypothetical protein